MGFSSFFLAIFVFVLVASIVIGGVAHRLQLNDIYFSVFAKRRYRNLSGAHSIKIDKSLKPFYQEESFKSSEYLKDIIGVSKPNIGKKEKVIIKAFDRQRLYISTKPIHNSQRTMEMNEEYGIFSIEVFINFELQSKLLSYGEHIQVLKPSSLTGELNDRIKKMDNLYTSKK